MKYLVFALFVGCIAISKFDQYSYQQATSLKVDAINLMAKAIDSFQNHADEVEEFNSKLQKQMEYEKFRNHNEITIKMYNVLWTMLNDSSAIKLSANTRTLWNLVNDTSTRKLLGKDWEISSDTSIEIKSYQRGFLSEWKHMKKFGYHFVNIAKAQIAEGFTILAELETRKVNPNDDKVQNFISNR